MWANHPGGILPAQMYIVSPLTDPRYGESSHHIQQVKTNNDRENVSKLISNHLTSYNNNFYHIFTTKYVLFAYAIQTRVTFTYHGTVSRKPYPFKN